MGAMEFLNAAKDIIKDEIQEVKGHKHYWEPSKTEEGVSICIAPLPDGSKCPARSEWLIGVTKAVKQSMNGKKESKKQ